jgi:hypothetical protein
VQNVKEENFGNLISKRNIFSGENEETEDDLFRPVHQDQFYIAILPKKLNIV